MNGASSAGAPAVRGQVGQPLAAGRAEVVFAREAIKDRRRIPEECIAEIADRLQLLAAGATRNLDIKPLMGHKPWLRLRVGDYRVVYRHRGRVILVARVVARQELESAVGKLR